MKDNFQGPQYNVDRQPLSSQISYPAQSAPGHAGPTHGQPTPWSQSVSTAVNARSNFQYTFAEITSYNY